MPVVYFDISPTSVVSTLKNIHRTVSIYFYGESDFVNKKLNAQYATNLSPTLSDRLIETTLLPIQLHPVNLATLTSFPQGGGSMKWTQ